jgi:hypothetical protein
MGGEIEVSEKISINRGALCPGGGSGWLKFNIILGVCVVGRNPGESGKTSKRGMRHERKQGSQNNPSRARTGWWTLACV